MDTKKNIRVKILIGNKQSNLYNFQFISQQQQSQNQSKSIKNNSYFIKIGRNPSFSSQQSSSLQSFISNNNHKTIILSSQSISRNHLLIQIKITQQKNNNLVLNSFIKDLRSSNGTFLNNQEIQSNKIYQINEDDQIRLGSFQKSIRVITHIYNEQLKKSNNDSNDKKMCIKPQKKNQQWSSSQNDQQSQSQSDRQRSRKKQSKNFIQLSSSTLKLLKQMTNQKKSKIQKIKFLKLMGHKNAEQCWDNIQEQLKGNSYGNSGNKSFSQLQQSKHALRKANQELQKQFGQGRSGQQKKGLGK